MSDVYSKAYQEMFDDFVTQNKLDLDDRYWPEAKRIEWTRLHETFQLAWGRRIL